MNGDKEFPVYPPLFIVRATEKFRNFCLRLNRRFTHPNVVLWEMAHNMWVSAGIGVVAQLGIADLLKGGPMSISTLAEKTETHPESLYRLMRMLSSQGLFREMKDGRFTVTPFSKPLQEDQIRYLISNHLSPGHFQLFGGMMTTIKTGENVHGASSGSQLFDKMEADEARNERFTKAMTSTSRMLVSAVLSVFSFRKFRKIIDVGGGQGFLLAAILSKYPQSEGVVFDLPGTISRAQKTIEDFHVQDRMEAVAGDFFKSVPGGGDLYLMKSILHDWNDDDSGRILAKVHEAMKPGARLLIIEPVIEPGNKPAFGKMTDILMMISVGGKERSRKEWETLLHQSGFRIRKIRRTVSPTNLIEAEKA